MAHMSEYKGWRIGVTPWEDAEGHWGARLEVWEPGKTPQTHESRPLRFPRKAASESDARERAREKWIDDQP
jgi:hypothetical protein